MPGIRLGLSAVLLLCSFGLLIGGAGQDKEDPILAQVKQYVKEPNKPFTMIVLLKVKEGKGEPFEKSFARAVKGTRQEKGNLAYDLNRDAQEPTTYLLYERWKTLPDLEAHLKMPHITALLSEIGDLLDGAPQVRVLLPAAE